MPLEDYWIDQHEVTNEEYKKFVDAGGYQKPDFWKQSFVANGQPVAWAEAMARLRDATGRSGPATWELGNYPKGQEKHPVAGVSWYEAAAYAEFAGKSLPTIYHWNEAAQTRASMLIVPGSNFRGTGTVAVGGDGAWSGFGTTDMAGNVKEWCWNESSGGRRYILGGGFGEPTYMFIDQDAQPAWDRRANYGFRCVKLSSPPPAASAATVEPPFRDFFKEKPVSDEVFAAYKGLYAYDRGDLAAKVESTETTEDWTQEKVSFNAAYGGERVVAYLFLPKNASPPYQTIVYFPGSSAIHTDKFSLSVYADFIPQSGRALICPDLQEHLREAGRSEVGLSGAHGVLARPRHRVVEGRRPLDRLSRDAEGHRAGKPRLRRPELGWRRRAGGPRGGEPLQDGGPGVGGARVPAGAARGRPDQLRHARQDAGAHVERPVRPLLPGRVLTDPALPLLGTPEKDKRHVIYETGHAVPRKEFIRESLDWLDKYLGPVKK